MRGAINEMKDDLASYINLLYTMMLKVTYDLCIACRSRFDA